MSAHFAQHGREPVNLLLEELLTQTNTCPALLDMVLTLQGAGLPL